MTQGLVGQLLAGHQEPRASSHNTATSPQSPPHFQSPTRVLGVLKSWKNKHTDTHSKYSITTKTMVSFGWYIHQAIELVIVYFKLDTYLVLLFKVLPLLRSLLPGHFPLHPHFFQKKPTSQPTYSITTQTFSGLLSSTQKYQSRKQTQEWKDWTT